MKRLICLFLVLLLTIPLATFPIMAAEQGQLQLGFVPADAVSNDDGSVIYLSSKEEHKVYSISTETFEMDELSFDDFIPESIYYREGKLYVALSIVGKDSFNTGGAFAIVDCLSFTIVKQYDLDFNPYNIIVTPDNNIYIRGRWSDSMYSRDAIYVYNDDGSLFSASYLTMNQYIDGYIMQYNEGLNRIYLINGSYTSPISMYAYSLDESGEFVDGYKWPYHGDFNSSSNFAISPDWKYIFNSAGYIASCEEEQESDMIKLKDLNLRYNDLIFDFDNDDRDMVYLSTISDKYIHGFEYNDGDLKQINSYPVESGNPQRIFNSGDYFTVLTKPNGIHYDDEIYSLERVEKDTAEDPVTSHDRDSCYQYTNVVYSENTHKTYIIIGDTNELKVYDHESDEIETTIKLRTRPVDINISEDGKKLWILNDSRSYIASEFDIETLTKLSDINYPTDYYYDYYFDTYSYGSKRIFNVAGKIFIINREYDFGKGTDYNLLMFDEKTLEYIDTFTIPTNYSSMCFDPDDSMLYIYYQKYNDPNRINVINKYNIAGDTPVLLLSAELDIELDREFKLLSYKDKLIISNFILDKSDLSVTLSDVPYSIYAVDENNDLAVTAGGFYNLINVEYIETYLCHSDGDILIFDRNGDLFFVRNNGYNREIIYKYTITAITAYDITADIGEPTPPEVDATIGKYANTRLYRDYRLESGNEDIAIVDENGCIVGVAPGIAEMTFYFKEFVATFYVAVDYDITSLNVEGYDIDFSRKRTSYSVMLNPDDKNPPKITWETTHENVNVRLEEILSTKRYQVIVYDANSGVIIKRYYIDINKYVDPSETKYPYILQEYESNLFGYLYKTVNVVVNPYYSGVKPEYYLVTQYLDEKGTPIFYRSSKNIISISSTAHYNKESIMVMIMDQVGQEDSVGTPLAEAIIIKTESEKENGEGLGE